MKPTTKVIIGCTDCPFYRTSKKLDLPFCYLDHSINIKLTDKLRPMHIGGFEPLTPNNCPLKTQPIIVTYES